MRTALSLVTLLTLTGAVAAQACSSPPEEPTPIVEPVARLETRTGTTWALTQSPSGAALYAEPNGSMVSIRKAGEALQDAVRRFLVEYPELFPLDAANAKITDRGRSDETGDYGFAIQSMVSGVPVLGDTISFHVTETGEITHWQSAIPSAFTGTYSSPAKTSAEITALVTNLYAPGRVADVVVNSPTLMFLSRQSGRQQILAYRVQASAQGLEPEEFFISAARGDLLQRQSLRRAVESVRGTGLGTDGQPRTFDVQKDGDTFYMARDAQEGGKTKASASPKIAIYSAPEWTEGMAWPETTNLVASTNTTQWESERVLAPGAAVDVYDALIKVDAYSRGTFKYASFDGKASPVLAFVHFPTTDDSTLKKVVPMENAYYDSESDSMYFGDKNTRKVEKSGHWLTSLKVVGHEFMHGVIAHTTNLEYERNSGALNESLADIFGLNCSAASNPKDSYLWQIEFPGTGKALRDLAKPSNGGQPDHMNSVYLIDPNTLECAEKTNDHCGVHINSGIPNHAFYLMAVGGKNATSGVAVNESIGAKKAMQLWWEVGTRHLNPTATFVEAAHATILESKRLKLNRKPVACAWVATGVLSAAEVKRMYKVDCGVVAAPIDTCENKADGYYCSTKFEGQFFRCAAGATAVTSQCPNPEVCVGPNATNTAIKCTVGIRDRGDGGDAGGDGATQEFDF
jgi:bacillolysin